MKFRASPDALMQKVGEESVILDLRSGTYFGLDPIGTRLWETIAAGSSIDELLAALTDEYEVPISDLKRDIDKLIADLRGNQLITPKE